jgi:hypothetical protein
MPSVAVDIALGKKRDASGLRAAACFAASGLDRTSRWITCTCRGTGNDYAVSQVRIVLLTIRSI